MLDELKVKIALISFLKSRLFLTIKPIENFVNPVPIRDLN